MSINVTALVWRADLDATTKIVALRLADFASDDGGNVFPSQSRVSDDTGLSIRAVRDAFRRLEALKVLVLVHEGDAARHLPKTYRIDLGVLSALPAVERKGQPHGDADPSGTTCRPAPDAARHHVPDPPAPDAGPSGTTCRQTVNITTIEPSERIPPQPPLFELSEPEPAKPQPDDALFAEWWDAVPKKAARGAALRAYRAARRHASPDELLAGIQRYAAEVAGRDPQFTKHPATWLNGRCWLDEPAPSHGDRHEQYRPPSRTPRRSAWAVAAERHAESRARTPDGSGLD